MPIIIDFTFEDGTTEQVRIPAQIWQKNNESVSKVFWFEKAVVNMEVDSGRETADINRDNNFWPERQEPSRFQMFNSNSRENPMQRDRRNKALENGTSSTKGNK